MGEVKHGREPKAKIAARAAKHVGVQGISCSVQGEVGSYLDVAGLGFVDVIVFGDADADRFAGAGVDE
jgi:hypothetical protein